MARSSGSPSPDPPAGVLPEHWTFYQLGQSVKARMGDLGANREKATREIMKDTSKVKSLVKQASYFCERYSIVDLKRLGRIVTKKEEPLRATHLMHLAQFKDEKDRQEWMGLLESEGWTPTELREAIRHRKVKPQADKGAGRRPKKPKGLVEGLTQVLNSTRTWLKYHDTNWAGESDWLAEIKSADPGTLQLLEEVAADLVRLRRTADGLEKRLSKIADQIRPTASGEEGRAQGSPKRIPSGGRSKPR